MNDVKIVVCVVIFSFWTNNANMNNEKKIQRTLNQREFNNRGETFRGKITKSLQRTKKIEDYFIRDSELIYKGSY